MLTTKRRQTHLFLTTLGRGKAEKEQEVVCFQHPQFHVVESVESFPFFGPYPSFVAVFKSRRRQSEMTIMHHFISDVIVCLLGGD